MKNIILELKNINWLPILGFYFLAFILSFPSNSELITKYFVSKTSNYLISDLKFFPALFGTLIVYLIATHILKVNSNEINITGSHTYINVLIGIVPIIVFSIFGINNSHNINTHFYALQITILIYIYAFGEEVFWRGFLQNYINSENRILIYIIIGILWWAWHIIFSEQYFVNSFLIFCIIGSILIGIFADKTKSIIATAAPHSLAVIISLQSNFNTKSIIAICLVILIWLMIDKFFVK